LLLQKLKVGRPQDLVDAESIVSRMQGKMDRRCSVVIFLATLLVTGTARHVRLR